jgi:hypothetical protein
VKPLPRMHYKYSKQKIRTSHESNNNWVLNKIKELRKMHAWLIKPSTIKHLWKTIERNPIIEITKTFNMIRTKKFNRYYSQDPKWLSESREKTQTNTKSRKSWYRYVALKIQAHNRGRSKKEKWNPRVF